jgi:hypothetical protein
MVKKAEEIEYNLQSNLSSQLKTWGTIRAARRLCCRSTMGGGNYAAVDFLNTLKPGCGFLLAS